LVQQRLLELNPNHPPVIATQTGKLSTMPHIHWQAYSSGAHIRLLYARAHQIVSDSPIGVESIGWKDNVTHPTIPGTDSNQPEENQKNLETFLGAITESLRGTGDLEIDRISK